MFYIYVIVEDPPKVLYERAINIAYIIDTRTFEDLLLEIASNQFLDKHVLVFGCEKKNDKWILLQDGLTDYLQVLAQLNFKMVRFLFESSKIQEIELSINDANSLATYKVESTYNNFYFTLHHKKEKLSRLKLIEYCKLIECSASEIWASEKCWAEIISEIFSLASMMRKYAEHLQKSSQLTYNAHHSTTVEIKFIDKTLQINEATWASLRKYSKLMEFLKSYYQQRLYSFQPNCNLCKPVRMPIEKFNSLNFLSDPMPAIEDLNHYASFNSVYGIETNESHCPSLLLNQEEQEHGSNKEELQWQTALQNNLYTCSGSILLKDHQLYNILFVHKHISCNSPIETNYYACEHGDRIQLCYWCGTEDGLSNLPKLLTDQYKIVYPCCNTCKELEKNYFTHLEIKVGKNSKKRKQKT
ncbi:12579_t:CDS:2 [Dentiscutata heterogama]|uniref:12579_t:CDS:1 n=1 Tax=Dentiscutata heterogama TaxID=1316150 RepID=A0ACA9JY18_9GLOM|nr:12579_t:CDS:2 [Dentiscutata heterogama]